MYALKIERDLKSSCAAGEMYLVDVGNMVAPFTWQDVLDLGGGNVVAGGWKCKTGNDDIKDPFQLSGPTPGTAQGLDLGWYMCSPIMKQYHPKQDSTYSFAPIVPWSLNQALEHCPNRTYSIGGYFFMIHIAGRSTGCPAIYKEYWDDAVSWINSAMDSGPFPIFVLEK